MRAARLLMLLLALLTISVAAGSARSADTGPTGLHGFLLRADEPQSTSFSRTPSFAWDPVPGALHYEFQLSLSTAFHDNSIIYADSNALTPVEAPPITLPWITGSPHSLYARVRAITPDGATPWSANFGFDMVPPAPPTPLSSYPGLLRWTPVEGAAGYQVWLIDAHKTEFSATNTLDEREFYTFHVTPNWIGTVRWRIRALRTDATIGESTRLNGIPAVTYGAWSPIYSVDEPRCHGRPDQARRHRVGRLLERKRRLAGAQAHARVPLDGEPDDRRQSGRAVPDVHLHGQAVPEHRLHECRHRVAGVCPPSDGAAPASDNRRRHRERALDLPSRRRRAGVVHV